MVDNTNLALWIFYKYKNENIRYFKSFAISKKLAINSIIINIKLNAGSCICIGDI